MADYFKEDDYNYAFHFFGTTVAPEDALAHNLLGGRTIFDYYGDKGRKVDQRNIVSDQDPVNERDGTAVTGDRRLGLRRRLGPEVGHGLARLQPTHASTISTVPTSTCSARTTTSRTASPGARTSRVSGTAANVEWLMGANYFSEKMHGEVKVPLTNFAVLVNALNAGNPDWVDLPAGALNSLNYWQKGDVDVEAYGLFVAGQVQLHRRLGPDARRPLQLREAHGHRLVHLRRDRRQRADRQVEVLGQGHAEGAVRVHEQPRRPGLRAVHAGLQVRRDQHRQPQRRHRSGVRRRVRNRLQDAVRRRPRLAAHRRVLLRLHRPAGRLRQRAERRADGQCGLGREHGRRGRVARAPDGRPVGELLGHVARCDVHGLRDGRLPATTSSRST